MAQDKPDRPAKKRRDDEKNSEVLGFFGLRAVLEKRHDQTADVFAKIDDRRQKRPQMKEHGMPGQGLEPVVMAKEVLHGQDQQAGGTDRKPFRNSLDRS